MSYTFLADNTYYITFTNAYGTCVIEMVGVNGAQPTGYFTENQVQRYISGISVHDTSVHVQYSMEFNGPTVGSVHWTNIPHTIVEKFGEYRRLRGFASMAAECP